MRVITSPNAVVPARLAPGRRHRYALGVICLLAAVLYGWASWGWGWGNGYYSAAVTSMSGSLTGFLFGSFDPVGVVTVDKPPMALWPQVLSVWMFGHHGWALLLPQVVEGVATVFLLHRAVRRWAGDEAALIAALVLTLTPVTVVINRDNNPDTLLVLLTVAAAYALTRAMEPSCAPRRATGWLLLAAFLIGCGFTTKMLAAWVCLPAFLLAYLAGATAPWRRRLGDLAASTVVLLFSSLWWVALVDLWPGDKPYVGGSTDGTARDLVIGYNGLGRIFGGGPGMPQMPGGGPGMPRMPSAFPTPPGGLPAEPPGQGFPREAMGAFGGDPGPLRMFDDAVGGQVSWLLPLALLILVAASVLAVWRARRGEAVRPEARGGWLLWGGWLLTNGVVFSLAAGIFHPYYTTMLSPAIAALVGAGMAASAGHRWSVVAAAAAIVVTTAWAWVLISRDVSWNGWARHAVLAVAVAGIAFLVVRGRRAAARGPGVVAAVLLPCLLAPAVWSFAYTFGPVQANAVIPAAGPPMGPPMTGPGRMPGPGRGPTDNAGGLTTEQRKILDYAVARSGTARIKLAVDNGAMGSAVYILHSGQTVIGMGGFSGGDPAPSVAQLDRWVKAGDLRYVLGASSGAPRMGGEGAARRSEWIDGNCTLVPAAEYGGTEQPGDSGPPPFGGANVLYECGA
ncbi:ArnT family glycosyltransferase [Streptosporangium carneum]|uniref:Membrane protein n=1 Tax=Streptosporangium carneum TaxID=47481 RepID=A0A9W6MI61_9ACTN|nr:glycosyltransferase family 39 protein [Streptosporangium carneum]GLK15011.1 membrane protein [Streptosporangium carneum]